MRTSRIILQFFITLTIIIIGFSNSKAQNITTRWEPEGDKIAIYYDIKGARYFQTFDVSVFVSRDGGKTYTGPLKEIEGDYGSGISGGSYKILWDVMKEMPLYDEILEFKIEATVTEEERHRNILIMYVGNISTPLGLRIGLVGKTGFYIEARSSLMATTPITYTYENGNVIGYDKPLYYEFNGNDGTVAYSVIGGLNFQVSKSTFLYLGAGYGKEAFIYEINNFEYGTDSKVSENWVEDKENSTEGFEVDAGLMLRFGKVLISGGVTTINFESFNWTAGIGVSIGK